MIKDLSQEFVLVPNKLLWNASYNDNKMPSLPTRGKGPVFEEKKLVGCAQTGVFDKEDGSLEQNGTLKRFLKDDVFTGINAWKWVMSGHGKHYQFLNCQFTNCVFTSICWCNVRYTACQFIRCTFIDCDQRTVGIV